MELSDIKSVILHWSESSLINKELNPDDLDPIDKVVDPVEFDDLIRRASDEVRGGYDKTSLTVEFHSGVVWKEIKFYLTSEKDSLVKLL